MGEMPWQGDACSLIEAFRAGERSPVEELDATYAAIDASNLNAFAHLDRERAYEAAARADVALPFGGVPLAVKELTDVAGWPKTEASLALQDHVATQTATFVERLEADGGAVLIGQTTASEFGGVNLTRTKLHGITRNPWNPEHTPGGSSGGAAAAVAGGVVTLSTAGDGGGSIRIPNAFCGLPGLKVTYGRFPKGPSMTLGNLTAVSGCSSRSVRDIARWIDVANGHDSRDPYSFPRVEGWEAGLGSHVEELRGLRVAISVDLGGAAVVHPAVADLVYDAAEHLVKAAGLTRVDIPVDVPTADLEWAVSGLAEVRLELGDRWPECKPQLTPQIAFGLELAEKMYDLRMRARVEEKRTVMNEAMAALFDEVDLVICSTNPDIAFDASGPLPTTVGDVAVGPGNNGALTIPANIYGNPSMSIPVGTDRGLPVGMQVMARHHAEAVLLDLALLAERERPWPLVAPGSPL